MMNNTNYEKVQLACEELTRAGEKISADKVLAKVGGSKGTVVKYLRQWRENMEQQQSAIIESLGFSPEFLNAFNKEIFRYTSETKQRFTDLLDQSKESESYATTALQEAEAKIESLESEKSALNDQLLRLSETLKVQSAESEAKIESLKKQLQDKDKKIDELSGSRDSALKELAKQEIRVEDHDKVTKDYKERLEKLQHELKTLTEKCHQSEIAEAVAKAELKGLREKR